MSMTPPESPRANCAYQLNYTATDTRFYVFNLPARGVVLTTDQGDDYTDVFLPHREVVLLRDALTRIIEEPKP